MNAAVPMKERVEFTRFGLDRAGDGFLELGTIELEHDAYVVYLGPEDHPHRSEAFATFAEADAYVDTYLARFTRD